MFLKLYSHVMHIILLFMLLSLLKAEYVILKIDIPITVRSSWLNYQATSRSLSNELASSDSKNVMHYTFDQQRFSPYSLIYAALRVTRMLQTRDHWFNPLNPHKNFNFTLFLLLPEICLFHWKPEAKNTSHKRNYNVVHLTEINSTGN